MRYLQLFGKTKSFAPKEAETISHKLLTRAGYIDRQLVAGIYSFLPLGWKTVENIMKIIREEMDQIGGQEVFLPTLQPKELWERSDRWEKMDPPLFKLKDRHDKELALGSTHEEVMTDLVSRFVQSYKDLPIYLYQIQNKFRNEMRSTGGLLRVREFLMKDLYSFNESEEDLDKFYLEVVEAYKKIFQRCGLVTKMVEAQSGSIGGNFSHEFMMLCPTGEDKVLYCTQCDWAINEEKMGNGKWEMERCPKCDGEVMEKSAIENGHVFKLGTRYSEKLGAYFTDEKGEKKPVVMGSYGIGLGRLMATIVESSHDDKGIIWPKSIAPYQAHLISLRQDASRIYEDLTKAGVEVLYDDREEVSAGEKFADADLVGLPVRLVISDKTKDKIEWKKRKEEKSELLTLPAVLEKLADE